MLVKICGLTDAGDVAAAVDAGADALGFVFAASKRRVTPEQAVAISRQVPDSVLRVAVMLHPEPDEWRQVAAVFSPDVLQTDAEDFSTLDVGDDIRRWPVFRERGTQAVTPARGEYVYEGAKSGQGETINWARAAKLARHGGMILAGGLGPDNVATAVRAVRPTGVDASSGIERAPGRKCAQKMQAYVAAAKAAAVE